MGYSLSTPCQSAKARDEMVAFLEQHHRPFSTVIAEARAGSYDRDYDPTVFICVGDELAYGAGPSKIGFNFSTSGDYAHWMWTLCRWVALQVGRKRTFKTELAYPTAFPYVTWDSEAHPVLTPADIEGWDEPMRTDADRHLCDEFGFREHYYRKREELKAYPEMRRVIAHAIQLDGIAHREIKRLDALWRTR
jgi:hypothetical protein